MKALRHDVSPALPICMEKARLRLPKFGMPPLGVGLAKVRITTDFPRGVPF